jgi:hypothetical protein
MWFQYHMAMTNPATRRWTPHKIGPERPDLLYPQCPPEREVASSNLAGRVSKQPATLVCAIAVTSRRLLGYWTVERRATLTGDVTSEGDERSCRGFGRA